MKLIFILLGLIVVIPTYAENYIYCSPEIECYLANDIGQCAAKDGNKNNFEMSSISKVVKGVYKLKLVASFYDAFKYRNRSQCVYSNYSAGFEKMIRFIEPIDFTFHEPYLEAADYGKNSKWVVTDASAICVSSNPQDCPMHMVS